MKFFKFRKPEPVNVDYTHISTILEQGDPDKIKKLLFQPEKSTVEYLPSTNSLLEKLKKPDNSDKNLQLHLKIKRNKYELLIFQLPWLNKTDNYQPIIINRTNSTVVGIMLPFNELSNVLSKKESSDITKLGLDWMAFILSKQYGIQFKPGK